MTEETTYRAPETPQELEALAARHGLNVRPESLRVNEAGLDFRVAFAQDSEGADWVLRVPRRRDLAPAISVESRILNFVSPRLCVAVPRWEFCSDELVAYRRLPGEPGLTLDDGGQPIWHYEPASIDFATALGELIAALHGIDSDAAVQAGVPEESGSRSRAAWRSHLDSVRNAFRIAKHLEERWEEWLADDELWPETSVLTHGELYAAHVLLDTPARITGVLDWTTARVADPALDFTFQHMMGLEAFEATVAAYRKRGGPAHPRLADRCAALSAASPLHYAVYALRTQDAEHLSIAAAQLDPDED